MRESSRIYQLSYYKKTDTGKMKPFWSANKANLTNQLEIDVNSLNKYAAAIETNSDKQTAWNALMPKASEEAKEFAASADFASGKVGDFETAQREAIQEVGFFKSALTSLKAVAITVGSALLEMAAMFVMQKVSP